jgi:hypothetical protein
VISLGGIISKQSHQTTHLIVNNIDRTAKLLKCINYCDYIIHLNWLLDSKQERKFLGSRLNKRKKQQNITSLVSDPNLYIVKDEEFEKKYDCNIKESVERAKENGPLFMVV